MSYVIEQRSPSMVSEKMYKMIMEELGQAPPAGLLCHIVVRSEEGLRHINAWQNQKDFEEFREERLLPALTKVMEKSGIKQVPQMDPPILLDVIDFWVGQQDDKRNELRRIFDLTTDAFNTHDIDAWGRHMSDNVTLSAPGDVSLEGRPAVTEYFRGWTLAFSDARVEITGLHLQEDAIVEEGIFTGTHDSVLHTPTGDIAPTGQTVRVRYVQLLRFTGTRISDMKLTFDRMSMLEQLGRVPAHATAA
jgi:predicted ester cyclase